MPHMPLDPPLADLSKCLQLACEEGDAIVDALFEDDFFEEINATMIEFDRCIFRRVQFTAGNIDRIHALDCRFEGCDFSGFTWREGTIRRSVFDNCRGVGATFMHMNLHKTYFSQCLLNYLSLIECKFTEVSFSDCIMEHALFHVCSQKQLTLRKCRMCSAEIIETRMKDVDLSDCDIGGVRTSVSMLEGAKVSLMQAPLVLNLCGIQLKD